ncbi:MAG: hypothetical protein SV775_05010 [Thermodesulfobacteriota bacterium]|nr:hypothetical protein [Thermodesulfobacteriota bacterium]
MTYVKNFMLGLCLVLVQCCAPVLFQAPSLPLGDRKIAQILSTFKEQDSLVHAIVASGRLIVKKNGSESESDILVAGIRNPFRVKMEVTHPWGRPLVHFLINETELQVLSFVEKRLYHGRIGSSDLSSFFPGGLEPDQIWAIVRGYPILRKHSRAVSLRGNQISLVNGKMGPVQVIDLYSENNLPCLISFPEQGIRVSFSDVDNKDRIQYARKMRLDDPKEMTAMELKLKTILFNGAIPKSVLNLEMPLGFKTIPLPPLP